MGRILASHHYPDFPFVMSNIQNEIGTHMTYEVLTELKRRFPENRFIWTMGADNLATFHTWENASDIMENFPIAVLDRPPYTQAAQSSYMALTYAHLKTETAKDLRDSDTGWHFLNNPLMDMSSSSLLADLFNAKANDDPRMKEVLEYIREHGLYPQSTSAQPNSTLNKG